MQYIVALELEMSVTGNDEEFAIVKSIIVTSSFSSSRVHFYFYTVILSSTLQIFMIKRWEEK